MELNIRKAVDSDAKSIAMINVSSWQKTYKDIFPSDFLNGLSDKLKVIIAIWLQNLIIKLLVSVK